LNSFFSLTYRLAKLFERLSYYYNYGLGCYTKRYKSTLVSCIQCAPRPKCIGIWVLQCDGTPVLCRI